MKKNDYKDIFVIVPAYNEERRIGKLLKKIKKITNKIIVVDDGSQDNTEKIARKMRIKVASHKINLGKGAAMKTGAEVAIALGARKILYIDGDGQHDPQAIPEILKKLDEGFDIVFGSRNISVRMPFLRHLGKRIGSFTIKSFFGVYHSDPFCGYLAMTKKTYKTIKWDSCRYGVETEIVARVGKNRLKYAEVPIKTIYLDRYKGMTILDAFEILISIPKLKFT